MVYDYQGTTEDTSSKNAQFTRHTERDKVSECLEGYEKRVLRLQN